MTPATLLAVVAVLAVVRAIMFFTPKLAAEHKTLVEYLDSIVVAGLAALFLITFVVRSFYIPSGSMEHTLEINDYILVNEWVYRIYHPARGDIIVFKPPPSAHEDDKDLIKRIIAVGGDTVSMKGEVVYVNGQPLAEPYKYVDPDLPGLGDIAEFKVPEGTLWMMGDNRHNSLDSRFWGPLPVQNVIGKASFKFFPPSRIGVLH